MALRSGTRAVYLSMHLYTVLVFLGIGRVYKVVKPEARASNLQGTRG